MKADKKTLIFVGSGIALAGIIVYLVTRKKHKKIVNKVSSTQANYDNPLSTAIYDNKDNTVISPNVSASLNQITNETMLKKDNLADITGSFTQVKLADDIIISKPCSSYIEEKFPIRKCMKGKNIITLQKIINQLYADKIGTVIREDGYFGPQTEMAIKASFGVDYITYMEFVNIKLKSEGVYL